MKTLYTLILALLITPLSYGQNQILNLELIPANPTSSDSVKVVAHLSFSSGSCELDTKDVIQTGTTFAANSHHCLGLATYICEAKDTFSLGVLPDDTYTFYIGLSTGGAPAPCTPGIISDDTDTLQFSVGVPNSINPIAQKHDFRFYPNPAQSQLSFEFENGNQTRVANIYGTDGRLLLSESLNSGAQETFNLNLPNGYYLLEVLEQGKVLNRKKLTVLR